MTRWDRLRERVDRGSLVDGQRANDRRLRCVHVAGDAQVPRVTGGAARRDGIGTRGAAGALRQLAMTAEHEVRCVMRARFREAANVLACQPGRVGQSHVARRARFVRHVHMRRIVPVTVDALIDDGMLHRHPRRAALDMTRGAIADQRAVGGVFRRRCAPVCLVCEASISGTRAGARLPLDSLLDHTVVARCARRCFRKHRLSGLDDAHMACGAQWEHLGVSLVRETGLRPLPRARRGEQCAGDKGSCRSRARGERRREPPVSSHRSSGRAGGSRM